MTDRPPSARRHRRVRRGEGEVTQWPRGVVGYVPSGPADRSPSPDEDRLANRLDLAGRLIDLLRAQGRDVARETDRLRTARAAFARGDRDGASAEVERLLADLGNRADDPAPRT